MSLINDMLRDLDARRSRPVGPDALALQGVGPTLAQRAPLPLGRLVLGIALAVGLAAGGLQAWSVYSPASLAGPPSRTLPAQAQAHPQPSRAVAATPSPLPDTEPAAPRAAVPRTAVVQAPAPPPAPLAEPAEPVVAPPAATLATSLAPPPPAATPPRVAVARESIRALSPAEQAQQTFAQGGDALQQGRSERAQALLQETLDLMPRHSQARLALAGLWVRQHRIEPALELLARGQELEPESLPLARLRGHLLLRQGRPQEARRVLEAAAPAASGQADYQALLGTLYQRLDRHELAVAHYRRALELQPDQGLWWMGLGVSLEQTQQGHAAREAFRNAHAYPLSPALQQYVEGRLAALGH